MELELEAGSGGGGSRVVSLSGDSPAAELGRGDLGPALHPRAVADRTVSRRHVSLRLAGRGDPVVAAFQVVGRNPVVVRPAGGGGDSVCRRGEKGELRVGDGLSLSLNSPSFWAVRRRGGEPEPEPEPEVEVDSAVLDAVARRERRTRERKEREVERRAAEAAMEVTQGEEEEAAMEVTEGEEAEAAGSGELDAEEEDSKIDLASIDPVREFGFLSMGHEFDSYPRGRIRPPKDWNWFLEEISRNSDDDDDDEVNNQEGKSKGGRAASMKKKEGEGFDEEWAGESEDEKETLSRGPGVKRQNYVTRSKDTKRSRKDNSNAQREEKDDEDEEDETLGGFIVNEEEDEPMDGPSDEDEEEEFDEEEDD